MCGMNVVVVATDAKGNILADFRTKAEASAATLAAAMVTYPSTHGVFKENFSFMICRPSDRSTDTRGGRTLSCGKEKPSLLRRPVSSGSARLALFIDPVEKRFCGVIRGCERAESIEREAGAP